MQWMVVDPRMCRFTVELPPVSLKFHRHISSLQTYDHVSVKSGIPFEFLISP
jgi:hypothetical protein